MRYTWRYQSPLGGMTMAGDGEALTGLWFDGQKYFGLGLEPGAVERDLPVFREAARWLELYFSGRDPGFTPPLRPEGSPFRLAVWEALGRIPFGGTAAFGDVARELARVAGRNGGSARAVGGAVGRNPISLIIPCHRVVGRGGRLTGYAGGLDRKAALLDLERRARAGPSI